MVVAMGINSADELLPDKMEAARLRREEKDRIHHKVLLEGAKMGILATTAAVAASFAANRYSAAYRRLTLPFKVSLVIAASTAGFFTATDVAAMEADRQFAQKFSVSKEDELGALGSLRPFASVGKDLDWAQMKAVAFKNKYTLLGYGYVGIVGSTLAYNFTRRDIFLTQKFVNARLVGQFSAIGAVLLIGAAASSGYKKEDPTLDAYYERVVNPEEMKKK
ncbi:hypothetical protein BC830DRAFT_1170650 [Chytriomyces sp. MP71]|nr:hypothetical protein BC830DRAFT_1170650 [Chytriomyces sp. MP71]